MVGALKPFAQLKVVELAGSIGGAYCGVGAATNTSRAALLGQNTEAMLMDVAGLSRSELSGLRTWQSSQLSRRSDLFAASR